MPGLKLTSKSCILSQILCLKLFQADLCSRWCLSNHSSTFEQYQILLSRAWSCWWTWGGSWICSSLRPKWEWGWAGECAGTASELMWQHKWKWGPEQLWEPPELPGYLWPPRWPNQGSGDKAKPCRCQGSTWPEIQSTHWPTAVGHLHEIILYAERYLPSAVIPGAPSICKTLQASKKLISALP